MMAIRSAKPTGRAGQIPGRKSGARNLWKPSFGWPGGGGSGWAGVTAREHPSGGVACWQLAAPPEIKNKDINCLTRNTFLQVECRPTRWPDLAIHSHFWQKAKIPPQNLKRTPFSHPTVFRLESGYFCAQNLVTLFTNLQVGFYHEFWPFMSVHNFTS